MRNPILAQTKDKMEGNLWGRNKDDYAKAVKAGIAAVMNGGANSILAKLKDSKDPLHDCVVGAVNLAIILRHQSRNTMPVQAMIPAATTLMMEAMDFAEMLGILKVNNDTLDQATHLLVNTLMHRIGVTPQMLHTAAGKVRALTDNPVSMARLKLSAGISRNPNAPVPTELPKEQNPDDEEAA